MTARNRTQPYTRKISRLESAFADAFATESDALAARAQIATESPLPAGVRGSGIQGVTLLDPNLIDRPDIYIRKHNDAEAQQELTASVRARGEVLDPIHVVPHPTEDGRFFLVDGQRRCLAAREAGLLVPALVLPASSGEEIRNLLIRQVILNSHRQDEVLADRACFFSRLAREIKQGGVASLVGVPQSQDAPSENHPTIQQLAATLGVSSAKVYLLVALGRTLDALREKGEEELLTRLTEHPGMTFRAVREAFTGQLTLGARIAALRDLDRTLHEGVDSSATTSSPRRRRANKNHSPLALNISERTGRVVIRGGWTRASVRKNPDRFRHQAITALENLRVEIEEAVREARRHQSSSLQDHLSPPPMVGGPTMVEAAEDHAENSLVE